MTSPVPIYLLPGMTPGDRIFDRLMPMLPNASVVSWLEPGPSESLTSYATRIAATLTSAPCFVAGVSFGGIVAVEVSRIVQPHRCFLISSIRNPKQLPPWLWMCRSFVGHRMLNAVGQLATVVPSTIRTRSTTRVTKLAGDSGAWHRWATSAVLGWEPDSSAMETPVIQIHGDSDTTFPIRYTTPDVTVQGGGHVLPMTHSAEVADAMLRAMKNVERG